MAPGVASALMNETRVRGRIAVHPRGFGFLTFDAENGAGEASAFITPPDLNPFLDGDVVSAIVTPSAARGKQGAGRLSASDLTLIERRRTELFGAVTSHNRRLFLRVDRLVANTDWPFEEGTTEGLREGVHVVARVEGAAVVPERVIEADSDLGLMRCVVRHGIRSVFPEAVIAAAEASAARGPAGERRDLRSVPTVTIDGPTTTDIDDALSVIPAGPDGALRVMVSIADVDAFVPEGSLVDDEAKLRGTSVYLAGRVIPMLPEALSSRAASLVQDQDRPALTAELRIDPEGRVTAVDLYASLIRSSARLTYDAVARFYASGDPGAIPRSVLATLRWIRTAAARLASVRAARGGVLLDREEAYVSFDPATREPTGVEPRTENEAHRVIERLMVAANEAVATWLRDRGVPGLYRVHDEPSPEKVARLAEVSHNFGIEAGFGPVLTPRGLAAFEAQWRGTAVEPALRNVLGKALGPARYTVVPGPHFGLAAPLYLHFTSPIRRYADLAVHRLIKRYLAGDRAFSPGDPAIESLAHEVNRAAASAAKAEAERYRMVIARLFAGRVGERLTGNVIGVQPFGLVVQMKGTGATGTIAMDALPGGPFEIEPSGFAVRSESGRYAVGDPIEVTIAATNEELGRVELSVAIEG